MPAASRPSPFSAALTAPVAPAPRRTSNPPPPGGPGRQPTASGLGGGGDMDRVPKARSSEVRALDMLATAQRPPGQPDSRTAGQPDSRGGCLALAVPSVGYLGARRWSGLPRRAVLMSNSMASSAAEPVLHTARSRRWRSRPSTGRTTRRPDATSAATATRLSTAGPAPPPTAVFTAVVDPSSITGTVVRRPAAARATSSASRVPDPASRSTSGVVATTSAVMGPRRRAHGWPGATTARKRSRPLARSARRSTTLGATFGRPSIWQLHRPSSSSLRRWS